MIADIGTGTAVVVSVVLALWLASMGAVWKVATILSAITGELAALRVEQAVTKMQTGLNAANLANIQQRLNVPQAVEPAPLVSPDPPADVVTA